MLTLHLPTLLMLLAIPAFLMGPLLSMLIPTISGWLAAWLGSAVKRATAWEANVSPLLGGALHLVTAFVVTVLLVKLGVSISPATTQCLKDPAGHGALSCMDADSIGNIVQYLLTLVTQLIGARAQVAQLEWKTGTGRYAGIRPRRPA
jgi:hypothetical protein